MNNVRHISSLGDAMLQRGRTPSVPADNAQAIQPVSEMAMVLTLDQLRPNPDNPRTSRNPRYQEIKASIRARGLDSIPKVTRDPDGDDVYIFSDGGNTRYQILTELWQETGEERFYRIHTIFKPWPGRLKCVIGHLAENEVRGDLTFIEKAFGVHKARAIQEEQLGRSVTLRELEMLLNQEGYPVSNSSISRMEDTIKYLFPYLEELLVAGMSRGQIIPLLNLRTAAENTWSKFSISTEPLYKFETVFGQTCQGFNSPDNYSLDMFRDEFIGQLLKALPHPSLNYDRWLIELDPKEQRRREQFGDPPPTPALTPVPERTPSRSRSDSPVQELPPDDTRETAITGLRSGTLTTQGRPEPAPGLPPELPGSDLVSDNSPSRQEIQMDLYGGAPVLSGVRDGSDTSAAASPIAFSGGALASAFREDTSEDELPVSSVAFAATGLEPVSDIWHIPALLDDVEHLQDMAYRLAFEVAEAMGCEDSIQEDRAPDSAGFSASENGNEFVLFLAGLSGRLPNKQCNMFMFCLNFFGSQSAGDTPVFADTHVVKMMRLIRVIRRLRELQRQAAKGGENVAGSQ